MKHTIRSVVARQIFDSRGRPTVEVDVELQGGVVGRAAVPSGASTGAAEAHELRDGDPRRYGGLGVRGAVANVCGALAELLRGHDVHDQRAADARMVELDGSPNLGRLGANAILGVSLAIARASAAAKGIPLYQRIQELSGTQTPSMPMPMVNILSGGLHAGRGMDVQDFLAVPVGAGDMEEAIELVARVRTAAADVMARRGLSTLLADEGGLSPGCRTSEEALDLMVESIEHAGMKPGTDMAIAIDVAASSLKAPGLRYRLARENREVSAGEMIEMVSGWVRNYPVCSVEDALDEEAWIDWQALTEALGARLQLVGDDLFSTHPARVEKGIAAGVANGVLIKLNQNGTLTGTLDVMALARRNGYAAIVSARSGETEDAFIADLAAGTGAGQIKIGSLRCSDRLSKYNQLLRIAEHSRAPFAGMAAFGASPA